MFVPKNLPPGSSLSPQEQVKLWIENPIAFWEDSARQFGEEFTVELGTLGTVVLFSNPMAVKVIFALLPADFECHQYNKHYEYVMGAESLLLQDGDRHKRQKKLLLPSFHHQAIANYLQIIEDCTKKVTTNWHQQQGQPLKIRPFIHQITLEVMLTILFGKLDHPLSKIIETIFITQVFQDFGSWSPWSRFGKLHPKIRPLLSAEIRACRNNPERNPYTLFNLLSLATDEEGEPLTDAEIQDHVFTLLIAGVDTTALAISWALYWIHQDQEIETKLRQELISQIPLDREKILELPLLHLIYQETLRMYPIVTTPIGRKLIKPKKIGNYEYPAGITLLPCTHLVHHREDIYPNPYQFNPERFRNKKYTNYEYFPFGGGNRLCLGANFAPIEIKLILATILSKYKLQLLDKNDIIPTRHGTLIAPSDNLQFNLTVID